MFDRVIDHVRFVGQATAAVLLSACASGVEDAPMEGGQAGLEQALAPALEWASSAPLPLVYNTAQLNPSRYLNDHSIIRGRDGTWHLFSITGNKLPPGQFPPGHLEDEFAHATATSLTGPWITHPSVLHTDRNYHGESHLWAPHVIESNGTYYMFYAAGPREDRPSSAEWAINLATSTDLWNWTRHPDGPLFRDGKDARDPYVRRIGNQWVMYYTATSAPGGGNHIVAYRTSTDLLHWSPRQVAYTDNMPSEQPGQFTESPFVVQRGDWWYLFIGPRGGYVGTDILRSQNPFGFVVQDYAGHLESHAPEVIQDGSDWWVSGAGSFQDGLFMGPLRWRDRAPLSSTMVNPAVARNADGRLEIFALSPDGQQISHRWQTAPNGPWSTWTQFGGPAGAVPTVGQNADGRLVVFMLGPDGASLLHRVQTAPSGGWSDWAEFGGPAAGAPVVGRNADGRLEVFALGRDGEAILHRRQTAPNGEWGDWAQFGGPAGAPPVVGQNADGRLEVFAIGPGGAYLAHRWQTAPSGGWSDWALFGGPTENTPAVGQNADGRLEVFAMGPGGDYLAHRWQLAPSGRWSEWATFGGPAGSTPAVGRSADGRLEVLALGPNGASVAHRWQTAPNGGWSNWASFGGPAGCMTSVGRQADGRLTVFALGPQGQSISSRTQTQPSSGWAPWEGVGGPAGGWPCGAHH